MRAAVHAGEGWEPDLTGECGERYRMKDALITTLITSRV